MAVEREITRYQPEDVIIYEGDNILEIRDRVDTSLKSSDRIYMVQNGDTLRNLADILYGDARLYWIIAEFNNIIDPYEELEVDFRLRVPSMARIQEEIL